MKGISKVKAVPERDLVSLPGLDAEPAEERVVRRVHVGRGHDVVQHRAEVSFPRRRVSSGLQPLRAVVAAARSHGQEVEGRHRQEAAQKADEVVRQGDLHQSRKRYITVITTTATTATAATTATTTTRARSD